MPLTGKVLIIPGHLGKDTGAVSESVTVQEGVNVPTYPQQERWVNLQQAISFCVAHAVGPYKNQIGVTLVVPNGEVKPGLIDVLDIKDNYFSLGDRCRLANDLNADMVSIHNNAMPAPYTAHGAEAIIFSQTARDLTPSNSFMIARSMMNELTRYMPLRNRGIVQIYDRNEKKYVGRELYVLKKTRNMCIITEGGFMSSERDIQGLDVDLDGFNEQVGACLYMGFIKEYLKIYEK